MKHIKALWMATSLGIATLAAGAPFTPSHAATTDDLDHDSAAAVRMLTRSNPTAAAIARSAVAVLVFPNIVKAGLVFGGAFGEGELRQGSHIDGYYNSFTASWGFQAGAQSYGYVVFLMSKRAMGYIHRSEGWEIGIGPTVVLVDQGVAKNLSTSTLKDDAYAFIFDQQGLMAGVSIEGTKITHIKH
jgi:lipid-binding SYLF domain-containing protein